MKVMDVNLRYRANHMASFPELIESHGDDDFKSPRRSTVPLLAYWSAAEMRDEPPLAAKADNEEDLPF
jgi:hypothetical protein